MKTPRFITLTAALLVLAGCATDVADKTLVIGSFDSKCPETVTVTMPSCAIDTVLTVDPGSHTFRIELPTDLTAFATIEYDDGGAQFIPDGTTLLVHFNDEYETTVTSKQPKRSATVKMNDYIAAIQKSYDAFREAREKFADLPREEAQVRLDAIADSVYEANTRLSEDVFTANKDNVLAIAALFNMRYSFSDEQLDSLIRTLDPKVRANEEIRQLSEGLAVRLATGEGKPFKDFTVLQPDGRSVSLSDYVGKGKYILLDFWASWCGPCKREIPFIKAAYDRFHGPDFDVVSVAVWEREASASVDTAKVYGIGWNHILDAKTVPTELYGVDGIPHLILFAPDGTILKRGLRGEDIAVEVGKYVQPLK